MLYLDVLVIVAWWQGKLTYEAVRGAWDASYRALESAVEALSDADFDATSLVVTTLQDSIDGALANNTYEHYAEHGRQIEQWRQRSQNSQKSASTRAESGL